MKKSLKILLFIFLFCVNFGIVKNIFAAGCTDDSGCNDGYYCLINSGQCQEKHSDGWSPCAGNRMCKSGNCLNSFCQPAGYVAVDGKLTGFDANKIYYSSTCSDECPSGYVCTFYKRADTKDQYKCVENVSGYTKTTCLKMSFGLPIAGMAKGDCVDYDQGIPNLFKNIIQFLLASIGTVATILVIIAGFMWSFSAGNPETIKKARKMLTDAGIGMIVVIFSGSILAIVNPDLVNTSIFKAVNIQKINVDYVVDESIKNRSNIKNIGDACTSSVPLIEQNSDLYRDVLYKDKECYTTIDNVKTLVTIGNSGCAPTAISMIFKYYGNSNYDTPTEVAKYAVDKDFLVCKDGTSSGIFKAIASSSGFRYEEVNKTDAKKYLSAGVPLIARMGRMSGKCTEYFTSGGHYLVLTCYNERNNSVGINDPYIWKTGKRTSADFDSVVNCMKDDFFYYIYYKQY